MIQSRLHIKKIINGRPPSSAINEVKNASSQFPEVLEDRGLLHEEDENPFQKGSLLANIRESTDNYVLEAMNDPSYSDLNRVEVAKRLQFPQQAIPVSKEPKLMLKSREQVPRELARPKPEPQRNPLEEIERRHQERLANYKLLIDKEKAAISKEKNSQKPSLVPQNVPEKPKPSSNIGGLADYYKKLNQMPKPESRPVAPPRKTLLLMRLDERVVLDDLGSRRWLIC